MRATTTSVFLAPPQRVLRSSARKNSDGKSALQPSARCAATARFSAGGWPAQVGSRLRLPCTASVEFCANGRLCVRCGTQDIGTGTYTVFAQVLSDKDRHPARSHRCDPRRQRTARRTDVGRIHGHRLRAQRHRRGRRRRHPEAAKARRRHRWLALSQCKARRCFFHRRPHSRERIRPRKAACISPTCSRWRASMASAPKARRSPPGKIRKPRASRCTPMARSSSKSNGSLKLRACA